jgi:Spy/CpxP family protein refolding chaperone
MQQELGLTDEQVKEMREIREQGGSREEVHAVLTTEQKARAAELRTERKGERAKRMKEHLDLSDEQVTEIRGIRQAGGSREEIRTVLTSEQQEKFDQVRSKHKGKGHQREE